ncbi:hypothetical protein Sgri01_06074 [Streptomyces griseus]
MRVRAGDAERRHARPPRTLQLRPRPGLRQQLDGPRRPVDVRGRLVHVQRPGQHPMTHRHDHLDDAADPGSRLRMADVRLQRAQPQGGFPVLAVGRDDGLRLDRVPQDRPGAVRLHDVHVRRGQPGGGQRLPHHPLLCRPVRRAELAALAVLVDRTAPYETEDPVAEPLGVGQPRQRQHADALAPARPVRRRRERLRPAVRRQAALPGELDEEPRRRHHGDTAGQRQRALARTQRLHREVDTDQRRRARRVHRDRGALEAEGVGDTARRDTVLIARQQEAVGAVDRRVQQARTVLLRHHPDEHARVAAAQGVGADRRALQHLPRRLQEQPLLRVRRRRLTG